MDFVLWTCFVFWILKFEFSKSMAQSIPQAEQSSQPYAVPLIVLIRDREGILFEGEAESVSSFNDKGPFDVLSYHTNFISLIKKNVTVRRVGGAEESIPLEIGVMKVKENRVEVYVGIIH